ncbi:reverse transcriptase domain-containing protein [Tanacetum coccineum]
MCHGLKRSDYTIGRQTKATSAKGFEPPPPLPKNEHKPEVRKNSKFWKLKLLNLAVNEPPEVELKELPPHLEYAFLEGDDKLPVIIAKDLKDEEKAALLKIPTDPKRSRKDNLHRPERTFAYLACLWGYQGLRHVPEKMDDGQSFHDMIKNEGSIHDDVRTPFSCSERGVESFNTLKRKLTEAPILIAPDWDLPFELMCDASDFAIGAVLGQRKNKHFQPIHYASKTMNEAQTHYTTNRKELLS